MARPAGGGGAVTAVGAITGGLLSSSCCVLQLLLNWTPIGVCAGFSVFTPYQAHLRLVTVALLARLLVKYGVTRRTLATAIASCLLMASQDALAVYNQGNAPLAIKARLRRPSNAVPAYRDAGSVCYSIAVSGLKCEACASRLRSTLAGMSGVTNVSVHFEAGAVVVWAEADTVQGSALVEAIQQLDPAHYKAEVADKGCVDVDLNTQQRQQQQQQQQQQQEL